MRRITRLTRTSALAAAVLAPALALASCGGLPAAETRAYLDSIPLGDLPSLAAAKGNGTWSGTYAIALPAGAVAAYRTISVNVVVSGAAVTAVSLTSPQDLNNSFFAGPMESQVVSAQSLEVDGVSSVSYSSKAFVKAVENALSK